MKNDFISKNKEFLYLAFIVVALITVFPLLFTGFATADDFHDYLVARRGQIMADSSLFAQIAGRFYYYIVRPVYNLPFIFDNMAVVKLFHYIPLIVSFLLFAKIVFVVTKSKEMSWLFLLIFLMTMQISEHTSLFVAYPFYFSFSFSLLLVSFLLLLRYYERKKTSLIIFAALFFAAGLLFYETYFLFLVFFFMTIVYYNMQSNTSLRQTVKDSIVQFLPFFIVGVIYLAAYFIFRIYHPSQYSGTNFGMKDVTPGTFFMVLWNLSFSSFPMTIYETAHNVFWEKSDLINGYSPVVLNLLLSARVEWIVKGIMVAFFGYKLLMATPSVKTKGLIVGGLAAILLIFLPHVPLALTEKYTVHAGQGHMIGYVTTFFSFFGTLLLITILLSYVMNLFNFSRIVKSIVTTVFVFGFFICSVLTDFSNYSIAKDIRSANLRFYAIDELLKTDEFKAIPAGSPFFARDLWNNPSFSARGLTEQDFNWYEYFEAKNGVTYPVGREAAYFLDYSKKVSQVPYFLTMRQAEKSEDVVLAMAQMAPLQQQDTVVNHFADRATFVYYSSYKTFTISFKVKSEPPISNVPIKVNHIVAELVPDKTVEITIYNTKKSQPATIFTIQFPGIDLNTVMISNMVNRSNKIFYL